MMATEKSLHHKKDENKTNNLKTEILQQQEKKSKYDSNMNKQKHLRNELEWHV